MKRIYCIIILIACFAASAMGQRPVHIFLPEAPTAEEQKAAELLKSHMVYASILMETSNPDTANVLSLFVGNTRYAQQHLTRLDELRDDGFRLCCNGRVGAIYGNKAKSVQYGAAHLLELMGHYLTWIDYQPRPAPVDTLPVVDEVNNPSFAHREMWYYAPYHSQEYADWHGLHFRSNLQWADSMFVHTFQTLVPTQRYFDRHPEWYSEINGRRVRDGQLCLSNLQVLDTLCANLARMISRHPEAQIWSVSNNDNINGCQCSACRHADSLYGGASGTLVHFINQVARRFPDKTISTLAYQYTRHAPKPVGGHIETPDSNVNIMFCSIECGREKSLSEDASFAQDMRDWSALTSNIFMWDYVVQFRNFWDPFPNLHVLGPNLQFFRDNGVRWMFEQGTGGHNVTSWMELRQYLLAKLMWNADADPQQLMRQFLNVYYGLDAGQQIFEMLQAMEQALLDSHQRLDIYGYPIDAAQGYLSPKMMGDYQQVFRHLYEGDASKDSVLSNRIRFLELSFDFARIELIMAGVLPMDSNFATLVDNFLVDGERLGINSLHEMGYSLEQYRAEIDNYLSKLIRPNLARGCRATLKAQPSAHYYALGAEGLTDGRCGVLDYRNRWLGFNPDTIDAVIDLGKRQPVSQISLDFYFYPLSWIFLPQQIEYYCSTDGKHWHLIETKHPVNPEILAQPAIHTFATQEFHRRARFIRVVAIPMATIPSWHRATGQHPWIFTDEIIVR